jgi:hypothetical protein
MFFVAAARTILFGLFMRCAVTRSARRVKAMCRYGARFANNPLFVLVAAQLS